MGRRSDGPEDLFSLRMVYILASIVITGGASCYGAVGDLRPRGPIFPDMKQQACSTRYAPGLGALIGAEIFYQP
jgi:hypothetical protein